MSAGEARLALFWDGVRSTREPPARDRLVTQTHENDLSTRKSIL